MLCEAQSCDMIPTKRELVTVDLGRKNKAIFAKVVLCGIQGRTAT